jgi:hypothetical protein
VFMAPTTSHLCQLMKDIAALQAARVNDGADAHRDTFRRALDRTGQLTAVDGALILREDLTVVGFGAKLVVDGAEFECARFDALISTPLAGCPVSELGGTRHQSAARFVREHSDCSVLVSSQDGRMTLFSWSKDPGCVVALSGLEHFAWGEES